jgi:hypothetical protein
MNERTIDLYKQATEFAYDSIGKEHSNTAYFQGTIAGKFAELIVLECAEFADEHNSEVEGVTLGISKAIKQHFGVEE